MKKIYLASSFAFTNREKTESRKSVMFAFKKYLVSQGFEVYNPSELKIENAWDYSMYDWGNLVYQADLRALSSADIVVFISYGKENNAGALWEIGYAAAKNIPIILVSMNSDSPESLMCIHSATACLDGFNGLKEYDLENLETCCKINCVES